MLEVFVTRLLLRNDRKSMIAYNDNYDSVLVVEPTIDDKDNLILNYSEPDGIEREYWRNQFGIISDEEFQKYGKMIEIKEERKTLYKLLKKEFEEGDENLNRTILEEGGDENGE